MPEVDALTIGGGVDFSKRIDMTDIIAPTSTLDLISSSASDTAVQCKYTVRDPTSAIQTATLTATGVSPSGTALGGIVAERIMYALLSGASANGPNTAPTGTLAIGDVVLAQHNCVLPAASVTTDGAIQTAQAAASNHTVSAPALFQLASGQAAVLAALPGAGVGMIIWIRNNTPAGVANQLRRIVAVSGFGTDIVAVNRDWTVVPNATTQYKILNGMLFDLAPNQVTTILRLFDTSTAQTGGGSTNTYYEKVFVVNNNTTTSETGAAISALTTIGSFALPAGATLDMALTTALNDAGTVANRQTAPSSGIGSFIAQLGGGVPINVPGPGNLPAGAVPNAAGAQGAWLRLTLTAGTAAYKGPVLLRVSGTTT